MHYVCQLSIAYQYKKVLQEVSMKYLTKVFFFLHTLALGRDLHRAPEVRRQKKKVRLSVSGRRQKQEVRQLGQARKYSHPVELCSHEGQKWWLEGRLRQARLGWSFQNDADQSVTDLSAGQSDPSGAG